MPDVLAVPTTCAKCGGHDFWDNRADKKNPRGPDFKCKEQGCGEGYWLKAKDTPAKKAPASLALVDREEDATVRTILQGAAPTSWDEIKVQHMEAVVAALVEASMMDATNKVGSDPAAVAALANTMFIERRRKGV